MCSSNILPSLWSLLFCWLPSPPLSPPLSLLQASELPREPLQPVSCRDAALQEPLSQLLLALLRPGRPLLDGAAWNHTGPLRTLQTLPRQVCGLLFSDLPAVAPVILTKHVRYYSLQQFCVLRGGLSVFMR